LKQIYGKNDQSRWVLLTKTKPEEGVPLSSLGFGFKIIEIFDCKGAPLEEPPSRGSSAVYHAGTGTSMHVSKFLCMHLSTHARNL
jgi:hypothetical protein